MKIKAYRCSCYLGVEFDSIVFSESATKARWRYIVGYQDYMQRKGFPKNLRCKRVRHFDRLSSRLKKNFTYGVDFVRETDLTGANK